jgi:ascorbate-specific PTS system EIIC-type component UlaA
MVLPYFSLNTADVYGSDTGGSKSRYEGASAESILDFGLIVAYQLFQVSEHTELSFEQFG